MLLLPGDTYATRRQGPVLQQLQHPIEADVSVNDAFRPVSRFFDRITRPEQLLTALPAAMRVLVDPVDTGAVVLALPQDVQSHAYDYPAELFDERDWIIRRPLPGPAGGGRGRPAAGAGAPAADHRRRRGALLRRLRASSRRSPSAAGIPVAETFAGKGAVQRAGDWWQLGGIGLEGTPATNELARQADLVLTVGSRLTDFATASQSLFEHPDVRFASINVDPPRRRPAGRHRRSSATPASPWRPSPRPCAPGRRHQPRGRGGRRSGPGPARWAPVRAAALDADIPFDRVPASRARTSSPTPTPCSPRAS